MVLNPGRVRFGVEVWEGVTSVVIDRRAERAVVEWTDAGPHAVMADVPEQRVNVRVERALERDDAGGPRPGDEAELEVFTSVGGSDAGRRRVACRAVVISVRHEVGSRGAMRVVEMVAVSASGSVDPVVVE